MMTLQSEFDKNLVRELLSRDNDMNVRQANWRNAWQDLATFMAPNAQDITRSHEIGGYIKNREVFDSTAIESASRLAGSLTGIVTSPSQQWFNFTFGIGLIELGSESKKWLQQAAQRTFLAIQRSNFSVEMLQAHLQLAVFGTTALYCREHPLKPGNLLFETLPLGSYRIQEGIDRRVDTVHRDIEMSLKQIQQHVEQDGWTMHPERVKQLEKHPFMQIKVLNCIFPQDQIKHELDTLKISSVYIDIEKKTVMGIEGFPEMPINVSRWMTSGRGEEYGRSPGFKALPDTLTLNKAEEYGLRSYAKAVDPPVLALHQSVLGTPDLRPSQLTYILEQGALAPFPHNPNIQVEAINHDRKVQSIKSIFLQDLIQFLPGEGLTPPTATQVNAQMDILLQIAGPELTRQEYELYDPTISRCYLLQQRAREIPQPTEEIKQLARELGIPIDIRFEGPIAKAKRRNMAQSIDTMLGWAGNFAQVYPSLPDNFNSDRAAVLRTELEGAPLEILATQEEIQQVRQGRIEAQQQQAQQEAIGQAAQSVRNLGGISALQSLEQ